MLVIIITVHFTFTWRFRITSVHLAIPPVQGTLANTIFLGSRGPFPPLPDRVEAPLSLNFGLLVYSFINRVKFHQVPELVICLALGVDGVGRVVWLKSFFFAEFGFTFSFFSRVFIIIFVYYCIICCHIVIIIWLFYLFFYLKDSDCFLVLKATFFSLCFIFVIIILLKGLLLFLVLKKDFFFVLYQSK